MKNLLPIHNSRGKLVGYVQIETRKRKRQRRARGTAKVGRPPVRKVAP